VLKIKDGVTPPNLIIAAAAANVGAALGIEVTITAGTDGKHMVGSRHYIGAALDIRLMGQHTEAFMAGMRLHLGSKYQVILEKDHVHIELDKLG